MAESLPLYLALREGTLSQADWQSFLRTHPEAYALKNGDDFCACMKQDAPLGRIQGICQATRSIYAVNAGSIAKNLCALPDMDMGLAVVVGPLAHTGCLQDNAAKKWRTQESLLAELEKLRDLHPAHMGVVHVKDMQPSLASVVAQVRKLTNKSLRRRLLRSLDERA